MENVFIDTCIYIRDKYIKGYTVNTLFDLAKQGCICILLPRITRIEVIRHLRKDVAEDGLRKIFRKLSDSFLADMGEEGKKAIEAIGKLMPSIPVSIEEKFNREYLDVATEVDIAAGFDINEVISKFEKLEYPFSWEKTQEFADALTLQMLEDWCVRNRQKCIVLSCDGDMKNYRSTHLKYRDYKGYIAEKLKPELVSLTDDSVLACLFRKEKPSLDKEIGAWLLDQLDDEMYYCMFLQIEDVNDYSIGPVEVEFEEKMVLAGMYDNMKIYEGKVTLTTDVTVYHPDYDTAFYDNEDGKWYFLDDNIETGIHCKLTLPVTLSYDEKYGELALDSVNKGDRLTPRDVERAFYRMGC